MTVLRREDVQSRVASWDRCPYRMASSPILAIVPLIIRRLRGPSLTRVIARQSLLVDRRRAVSSPATGAGWSAAHRKPASSRAIATAIFGPACVPPPASEPSAQPLLRLVRDRNHAGRLSFAPSRQGDADARPMLIVPRRFHQQPTDQRVARARDAATPMLLPAGVLARHQPEIRHQRPRRREPPKVMQLGQDQHRGQRIDAPETAQPPDALPIRLASRRSRPAARPTPRVAPQCDRSPADSRRRPRARRGAPTSDSRSTPMRPRPVAPAVVQAAAQQQLAQPMPTPLQILARIIARAAQIANRFVLGGRRLDLRQQARATQLRQLARIAAIRLDPLAGLPWNQRRRDHLDSSPARSSSAAATRSHTARLHNTRAPAPAPRARASAPGAASAFGSFGDRPGHRRRLGAHQHRDKEVLLVRIDPDVRGNLFHDRLLSSAALTPRGANPRSRWHPPPCRVRQHYDVTIASRSFHIV